MKKTKMILIIILSVLIVLTLAFIWGNSVASKETSANESMTVYQEVKPSLDVVFGKDKVTHNDFRKATHFCEFGLLGVEVTLLILLLYGKIKYILMYVPLGLFVAVIDETIQVLSNRGPSVVDVWIDFGGFLTAVIGIILITLIVKKIKQSKSKN